MPIQQTGPVTNNNRVSSAAYIFMPSRILLHHLQGWRPNEEPWQFAPQPEMFQDWQPEYREDDGTGTHWDNMNMNQGMKRQQYPQSNSATGTTTGRIMQREQALLQTVQNMTARYHPWKA
jgi:hypothetical protein